MTTEIKEIIQNLGFFTVGTVSLSGAIIWIFKSGITTWLTNKVELHKAELNKSVEQYKLELQCIASEHQIRYSRLHNDRAIVIKELYLKLVKMEKSMSSFFIPWMIIGDLPKIEKGKVAGNDANDFTDFIDENRIFFDEKTCGLVDDISNQLREAWKDLIIRGLHFDELVQEREYRKEQFEVWYNSWRVIEKIIPKLKNDLENEFRRLLGVIK